MRRKIIAFMLLLGSFDAVCGAVCAWNKSADVASIMAVCIESAQQKCSDDPREWPFQINNQNPQNEQVLSGIPGKVLVSYSLMGIIFSAPQEFDLNEIGKTVVLIDTPRGESKDNYVESQQDGTSLNVIVETTEWCKNASPTQAKTHVTTEVSETNTLPAKEETIFIEILDKEFIDEGKSSNWSSCQLF